MKRDVKVLLITFGVLLIFIAIAAYLCSRLFNLANIVSGGARLQHQAVAKIRG